MKEKKLSLKRVDLQVSILIAIVVLLTSSCIFYVCYTITYKDTIKSLSDRVNAIYEYLETNLDKNTFKEIETREDMEKASYKNTKYLLGQIKEITDVMYLYTAKKTTDGKLIYVVDGLDQSEDFRYPGDIIEFEIQEDLNRALLGEAVLPDKITTTDWGKIFITYLPIFDGNEIVGAVGIEFEAEHQYYTYLNLKIITPIVCSIVCLLAVIFSIYAFKRISNPNYKDIFNTDLATQLKNRNSFEIDIRNMFFKKIVDNVALISVDLNNLKIVNDTLGHIVGDKYIQLVSKALEDCRDEHMVCYRIGGDEFAVVAINVEEDDISNFVKLVQDTVCERKYVVGMDISVSVGYALYDSNIDKSLFDTYKRADKIMYKNKKIMKENMAKSI